MTKKNNDKVRKIRPVSFTEKDKYLSEWAEKQDMPFSTYMKTLIRNDMKQQAQEIPQNTEIIEIIDTKVKTGDKAKKAYRGILGNLNEKTTN